MAVAIPFFILASLSCLLIVSLLFIKITRAFINDAEKAIKKNLIFGIKAVASAISIVFLCIPSALAIRGFIAERQFDNSLVGAAQYGNYEKVLFLLQSGIDPNELYSSERGTYDVSPLMAAFQYGRNQRIKIVELLIQYGADVNYQDRSGISALMRACAKNDYETVVVLLQSGADKELLNNQGKRAIDYTNSDMIQELLN